MNSKHRITFGVVLLAMTSLVVTGCFSGKQAGGVKFSGFLGQDYAKLQRGGPDQALYSYAKPGGDRISYTKILLEPVTVLVPAEEKGVVTEDMQKVANNFHFQLVKELSKGWEMVSEPKPNTLRLQVALTNISAGSGAMQAVTSVLPIGIAMSSLQSMVGGKPSFAGEVSVEAKVTDASTGELLGAGVDRRIADKSLKSSMDTWAALSDVTETWSKMFAYRLCKERGRTNCVSPFPGK